MRRCIYRFLGFACSLCATAFLAACNDFLSPVESTPAPSEYSYNYWLLQNTYLYEDDLATIPEDGDSVQVLYRSLSDKYTRYTEPSNSEAVITSRNTSIITGDIGIEFMYDYDYEHPLFIRHVYPEGPADRAGVPKNGNIIAINGVELTGANAYSTYRSVFDTTMDIALTVTFDSTTKTYDMTRESIYAPTVFIDTMGGYTVINIREFKLNTYDRENGSYGELRQYLDSTAGDKSVRILDLRNNPGGHVDHCIRMADLFVKQGTLSTRKWFTLTPEGKRSMRTEVVEASAGDPGEEGKFVLLANSGSASCAEIFAAAVTELADIPLVGITTFGKGIGQSSWNTPAGGLATITTLEFYTPKGNSYHKKGLVPQYFCEQGANVSCAIAAAEAHFGKALKKTGQQAANSGSGIVEPQIIAPRSANPETEGGAFVDNFVTW